MNTTPQPRVTRTHTLLTILSVMLWICVALVDSVDLIPKPNRSWWETRWFSVLVVAVCAALVTLLAIRTWAMNRKTKAEPGVGR